MITKRTGNGQTECKRCKDNGKWSLTWDSFLYTFNDKPYCFECLMEELENLQKRNDKAIDLVERLIKEYKLNYGNTPSKTLMAYETLLNILKVGE